MSANSISLYSSSTSNITLSSNNLTTLYPGSSGTVTPQQPYGNANVVSLLAVGTDGANTVGNISSSGIISATGNIITDSYFIGTFLGNISGNLTVPGANTDVIFNNDGNAGASSNLTFNSDTDTLAVPIISTPTVYSAGMQTQGSDYVQMQYSNGVTLPVSPYDIGTGSWFYLDPGGGIFQSNTTGTLQTVVLGNDGSVSATGNVDAATVNLPNGAALWQVSGSETELTTDVTTDTTGLYLQNNGDAALYANLSVVIEAGSGGDNKDWTFAPSGNLTLPTDTAAINYANGTSILSGLGSTYGNAQVATFLSAFGSNVISTSGNITGGYILGNGSQLTGLPATYGNANVVANLAALGTNPVSTTGNITASYFIGNGALLTSITASNIVGAYGNAQVASFLNAFGSNSISTTGNITSSYISGNGSLLGSLTGANVTGTVANATYATAAGSATTATTANTVTDAAQANITSVGTLTSASVSGNTTSGNFLTAGVVTATGNITGAYFIGNGSQLTGLPATYSNANATALMAAFGSNVISTSGNITGGYFIGNGSQLTGISPAPLQGNLTGNISGINTYGITELKTLQVSALGNIRIGTAKIGQNSSSPATIDFTADEVTTNLLFTAGGNITAPNVVATGNAYATYFIGNGSQLTGITAVGGTSIASGTSNVKIVTANGNATVNINSTSNVVVFASTGQFTTGVISASGNITTAGAVSATGNVASAAWMLSGSGGSFNGPVYSTLFSTTGNVNGANIIAAGLICATGNITTGQTGIIGTANTTGGVGNIILSGRNIATDMIRNPDSATGATADVARIVIGTGYAGNVSPGVAPSNGSTMAARLLVGDSFARGNNALQSRTAAFVDYVTLSANVVNTSWRAGGVFASPMIGGGSAANTLTNAGAFGVTGGAFQPVIGGGLTGNLTALGNTIVQHATGVFSGPTLNQGSSLGNSYGFINLQSHNSGGSNFANTVLGYTSAAFGNITPTTYISYHHPSNVATYGVSVTNQTRAATNYYFLKNDDAAAQAQIGSLRSYSEFNYTNGATSGAVTIDKTNGQVQQVNLAGNVSGLTYSNFVSSASDGTNTDEQADTVTIIFNQGATGGYGVTFPSGAAYKYAGGLNSLVATTAASVTLVAITAIRLSGTTTYLTTISPAFT